MWPFKKSQQDAGSETEREMTLKQRVDSFWVWFAENAVRFYETIEDKRCADLTEEMSDAIDRWLGGMAWVFGPGPDNQGHSFTLSGEGVVAKQFIAEYWQSRAPTLTGWTFYSFRQPSDDGGSIVLELDEGKESFKPIEFWVSPYIDDQEEKIDIAVWHPSIQRLPERPRMTALFLILDELLGEHGTGNWIGEIKFSEERLKDSIPIEELKELIATIEVEKEWKKYPPTETYISYRREDPEGEWARADVYTGSTSFWPLIREYGNAEGPCEHPAPELGVEYIFVAIEPGFFPEGREVDVRCEIEDAISERFKETGTGITFGGACGSDYLYIDIALYDGPRSLEIVRQVLQKHQVPKSSRLHWFTEDQKGKSLTVYGKK